MSKCMDIGGVFVCEKGRCWELESDLKLIIFGPCVCVIEEGRMRNVIGKLQSVDHEQ